MSELRVFENTQFGQVRIIEEDGKPLFCGSDVAKALGYNEPHKAVARHAKGGMKRPILTDDDSRIEVLDCFFSIQCLCRPFFAV